MLPVLVDRAELPLDLPSDLAPLLTSQVTSLRSTDYEADLASILATLWSIRLAVMQNPQVILSVGSRPVERSEFLAVVRKKYPPEVRLITLAATGRMELSLIDVKAKAPNLYVTISEDADERDRRLVAAFAASWDKVTVVGVGGFAGYTAVDLLAQPGMEWLRGLLDGGGSVEVAADTGSALPGLTDESRPRGLGRVRDAIAARPRAALLVGGFAVGGGAAAEVVATQGPRNPNRRRRLRRSMCLPGCPSECCRGIGTYRRSTWRCSTTRPRTARCPNRLGRSGPNSRDDGNSN